MYGGLRGGLRGPPYGFRRSRMGIDPRTLAQRNKACAREQQTVRVEEAVRPRAVCLLRFRTGTGWLVRISEAVGISEMPCRRQVAAAAGGIAPSEMRKPGSRSRGGLKGTWGAFKGCTHRNWGSRNSGAWRAPELNDILAPTALVTAPPKRPCRASRRSQKVFRLGDSNRRPPDVSRDPAPYLTSRPTTGATGGASRGPEPEQTALQAAGCAGRGRGKEPNF